jgi:hypothetical protein
MSINFFNSVEHLEPKCKKCESVIEYGVTTEYDENKETHVCKVCGNVIG